MTSIQDYWTRIKSTLEIGVGQWGMALLVILVAIACFGLGRLSALHDTKASIRIIQSASAAQALAIGGQYMASKNGETYYFPWCSGAANIQPQDQVWFKTAEAADRAGYRPAKNCKGLAVEDGI